MSEYKLSCPQCGQHIRCTEAHFGRQVNCPTCQKPILVARPKEADLRTNSPPAAVDKPKASLLQIVVISAVAFGLCAGLSFCMGNYYLQQRAQQKDLEQARLKIENAEKLKAEKERKANAVAATAPSTNTVGGGTTSPARHE